MQDYEVLSKRAGPLNNNVLIAHAACASVGFMILLPVGEFLHFTNAVAVAQST